LTHSAIIVDDENTTLLGDRLLSGGNHRVTALFSQTASS
jgi:hypothetical protein